MSEEKIPILQKGRFCCVGRAKNIFSALLLVGALFLAVVFVLSFINFGRDVNLLLRRFAAICFVMEGAFLTIRIILSLGREYSYEAGETDFTITDYNGNKEFFYYSDVSEVRYTPIKAKQDIRGYEVEIVTGYRTVKYRFHFGLNAENTTTSGTPFYYLEVNSGLRPPENLTADKEQIMAQFERMQLHQSAQKGSRKAEREQAFLDSVQSISQKNDAEEEKSE